MLWLSESIPLIIEKIASEIDRSGVVWADIDTKGSGVTPVVTEGSGVASVAKNTIDSPQRIVITLSESFLNANWVPYVTEISSPCMIDVLGRTVSTVTLAFQVHDGSYLTVDDLQVLFLGAGQM
jgi:hypothetical protein